MEPFLPMKSDSVKRDRGGHHHPSAWQLGKREILIVVPVSLIA